MQISPYQIKRAISLLFTFQCFILRNHPYLCSLIYHCSKWKQKQSLLGMTLAEITESVTELNLPKLYRQADRRLGVSETVKKHRRDDQHLP